MPDTIKPQRLTVCLAKPSVTAPRDVVASALSRTYLPLLTRSDPGNLN
jgi:hypothetical protein